MGDLNVESRLQAIEDRLQRLEEVLIQIYQKVEKEEEKISSREETLRKWITDYVSLRLQQLVPETCEHTEIDRVNGPFLEGTHIRCTEEVVHRVSRIPIPFVRKMVIQKVANSAREKGLDLVDIKFFEQAATF
jgi:hypothetical protein